MAGSLLQEKRELRISDRLRFAVELAERPLDSLTDGDWSSLQDRLQGFLMGTVGGISTGNDPPDCTRENLRSLKAAFRGVLEQVARGVSQAGPTVDVCVGLMRLAPITTTVRGTFADRPQRARTHQVDVTDGLVIDSDSGMMKRPHRGLVPRRQPGTRPRRTTFMLTVSGGVHGCALSVLMYLLAHEPVDHIRQCPSCCRLFIRRRAQRFCAVPSCKEARNARYWKTYVKTPRGTARRKQALERHYEKHGWTLGGRSRKRPTVGVKTGHRAPGRRKAAPDSAESRARGGR